MKKYCLGFAFNEKHTDVLLITKNRPLWQKDSMNGIGGEVNEGEDSKVAMSREFKEETGLDCESQWYYVASIYGQDWKVDVFTATDDCVFDFKTMTDEKVNLIPLNELDQYNLISNLYWLIPMCLDRKSINYKIKN